MELKLKLGMKKKVENIVTFTETARNLGSGNANVLATPIMIAWMENVAMRMVAENLPSGYDTVGTKINVSHISATPVGMNVNTEAELIEIDGRRLVFNVTAYDDMEKIGEGTHERFVIDTVKFSDKAEKKFLAK